MALFRDTLEELLPADVHENIGEKLEYIGKNIFLNEYLYDILANCPDMHQQVILK